MEKARVALDIQALQDGSRAGAQQRDRVARLASRLARAGQLAGALIAPELPAPPAGRLPPELRGAGAALLCWDGRGQARRLLADNPRLIHHIPVPLLHTDRAAPGGLVSSRHWADAAVPRIVTLDEADLARLQRPSPDPDAHLDARRHARLDWIRSADVVEITVAAPLDDVALVGLGLDPSRVAPPGLALEHLEHLERTPPTLAATTPSLPHLVAVFGPFPPGGGGIGSYNARFVTALAASGQSGVDAVTTTGMGWDPPPGVDLVHAESFGTDVRPASYDAVIYTLGNSDGHLATVEAALRHPGWVWLHEARLPAVATTALQSLDDEVFADRLACLLERAYPGRPPIPAARAAGRSHLALAAAGVGLTGPLAERATGMFVNSNAARHALLLDLPPLSWRPPVVVLPPACPAPTSRPRNTPATDLVATFGVVSMGKHPDLLVDAVAEAGCRLAFVGPCPEILEMVIRDRAAARGISDRVQVTGRLDDDAYWAWMDRAVVAVQLRDSAGGEMSAAVLDALAAGVPVVTNLPSAADYPEGTVEYLPDPEPPASTLAATIRDLLDGSHESQEHRAALSNAGRAFAASHQMEHLAAAVMAAVTA